MPMNRNQKQIEYIICEGATDKIFLERLVAIVKVNDNKNYLVREAKSKTKIVNKYKKIRKSDPYNNIIIFIDMDNDTNNDELIQKLKEIDSKFQSGSIYYVKPNLETYLILMKQNKIIIQNQNKIIEQLYQIDSYSKTEENITKIVSRISNEDIENLIKRSKQLDDSNQSRATNIEELINYIR